MLGSSVDAGRHGEQLVYLGVREPKRGSDADHVRVVPPPGQGIGKPDGRLSGDSGLNGVQQSGSKQRNLGLGAETVGT
jgi:hypothetical protein